MSTLQRIEAISKELSEMADKEDFVFVYGELLRRVRLNIERRGRTEQQATDELIRIACNACDSEMPPTTDEIEALEEEVKELKLAGDESEVRRLERKLDEISTIASY